MISNNSETTEVSNSYESANECDVQTPSLNTSPKVSSNYGSKPVPLEKERSNVARIWTEALKPKDKNVFEPPIKTVSDESKVTETPKPQIVEREKSNISKRWTNALKTKEGKTSEPSAASCEKSADDEESAKQSENKGKPQSNQIFESNLKASELQLSNEVPNPQNISNNVPMQEEKPSLEMKESDSTIKTIDNDFQSPDKDIETNNMPQISKVEEIPTSPTAKKDELLQDEKEKTLPKEQIEEQNNHIDAVVKMLDVTHLSTQDSLRDESLNVETQATVDNSNESSPPQPIVDENIDETKNVDLKDSISISPTTQDICNNANFHSTMLDQENEQQSNSSLSDVETSSCETPTKGNFESFPVISDVPITPSQVSNDAVLYSSGSYVNRDSSPMVEATHENSGEEETFEPASEDNNEPTLHIDIEKKRILKTPIYPRPLSPKHTKVAKSPKSVLKEDYTVKPSPPVKTASERLLRPTAARISEHQALESRRKDKEMEATPPKKKNDNYTPSPRLLSTTQSRVADVKEWETHKEKAKYENDIWWEARKPALPAKVDPSTPSKLYESTSAYDNSKREKHSANKNDGSPATTHSELVKINLRSPLLKPTVAVLYNAWKVEPPKQEQPTLVLESQVTGPSVQSKFKYQETVASQHARWKSKEQKEQEELQTRPVSPSGRKITEVSPRLLDLNTNLKAAVRSKARKSDEDPRESGWRTSYAKTEIPEVDLSVLPTRRQSAKAANRSPGGTLYSDGSNHSPICEPQSPEFREPM